MVALFSSLKLLQLSLYMQPHGSHPGGSAVPINHLRVELVTQGGGAIWHEGDWVPIGPGDLLWNAPGDHTIGRSIFDDPYHCLSITFQGEECQRLGVPRFSRWENLEEVKSFTRETVRTYVTEGFPHEVLRDYLLARVLFQVRRYHHQRPQEALPVVVREALVWLRKHYATPCRMADLAGALDCSPAFLFQQFAIHLKTTPHQIVIRERLRAARERLVSTLHPIKQIAVECGFSDASAFTHRFKADVGMTPGQYRERNILL